MTLTFSDALGEMPLVAILRGITPDEVEAIGDALIESGLRLIEIPLNSPSPFDSIARLAAHVKGRAIVGAGTVIRKDEVERVGAAGGQLIVSPHTDVELIRFAAARGHDILPGIATQSEAMAALQAGASALKLFPAETIGPAWVKAARAVLPARTAILPVGGVEPQSVSAWVAAGAAGFGLGSGLFKPGMSALEVKERALSYVEAWRAAGEPT